MQQNAIFLQRDRCPLSPSHSQANCYAGRSSPPLLPEGTPVWGRADNAYYSQDFAEFRRERGWDCSVSVTNPNCKAPVLEQAAGQPALLRLRPPAPAPPHGARQRRGAVP